jgi:hypothetical protein
MSPAAARGLDVMSASRTDALVGNFGKRRHHQHRDVDGITHFLVHMPFGATEHESTEDEYENYGVLHCMTCRTWDDCSAFLLNRPWNGAESVTNSTVCAAGQ